MRRGTARAVVQAFNHWRETTSATMDHRQAKEDLDAVVQRALREEMVERAHAALGRPFYYIGATEEWPRPGECSENPFERDDDPE